MSRNWVVRLGEMSFGIYLLHIPVLKIVNIVVGKLPYWSQLAGWGGANYANHLDSSLLLPTVGGVKQTIAQ